ncbi:7-cyano-7-deazaguanine synthase [Poriferisphaera corsica]|uniref:7-cyano-7-deazaguanine synthase n=1 Tax=Poriferisphaera corsica TaxID=2528020 RepID=A0A517YQ37_9BACT|nr:7-cyano-7-deazaguanine synthase [Poriferisphaera corsica]QDU32337.1 7-cyano-7-deazaguanine synthase [Poriferisphaera corsica]
MNANNQHIAILNSGGLRSLIATAVSLNDKPRTRASLIYINDGRDNVVNRASYLRLQADYFNIPRIIELDLPHIFAHGYGKNPDGTPMGNIVAPQFLLAALAQARLMQAEHLIWPISFNLDHQKIAFATEQIQLVEHLASLESPTNPTIRTPLLELADKQIIELGNQLETPFFNAWSCLTLNPKPCRACPACLRRKQAFRDAATTDPSFNPDTASVVK